MKRVPLQSVVVIRDAKRVEPVIGQPFDFTDEEVDQFEAMNPYAIGEIASVNVAKAEKAEKTEKASKKADKGSDGL